MSEVTLVDLAESGQLDELRRRLEAGSNVDSRAPDGRVALHAALAEGHLEIVLLLLEHGANPHVVDSKGLGVLHWAACANSKAILDVARDASNEAVDVVDFEGRTPLSWAAQSDDSVALEWLIENGADPNRVNVHGWGPLHFAASDGHVRALRQLLQAGARPLLRLPALEGEELGHLASDLARHFASHRPEASLVLEAAEVALE